MASLPAQRTDKKRQAQRKKGRGRRYILFHWKNSPKMRSTLDRQAFSLIFKPQSKCINILSTTARHNTALSSRFSSRSRCLTTNERNLNTLARQKPAIPRFQRNNRAAHFSTSSRRQATRVTLNPRVDEEGKPLTIEISQRAAEVGFCST